ncbi:type VI secretion system protein TssA [Acinetobacter populi]|uniref:ImpA family type VI secretion-associated protein n=1 Tax=Acinetobacter populi TaxID=1582270 RepID=A0A1Z9Z195_9GAMM|nr:type VI secretion system protein TssA [Acinetobacter populi]OUY08258.1 ImpA family type VI secretion-associated protein [Acinetobacter populi]
MEDFIKPISSEQIAGQNIEYDEDYQKLLNLVQEKPEQQFGDLIIDAQGPNWEDIYNLASEILLHKSKDLNVMSYFTQSAVARYGLTGLSKGLHIIYENLRLYWEQTYPHLEDEEGDFDPDYRINALSLFFSHDGIIKEVRNAFLIKNGLSQTQYNVREIEGILEHRVDTSDKYPGGLERLNIDLQIAMEAQLPELKAIKDALTSIDGIKQIFADKLQSSFLKFDLLEQVLSKIIKNLNDIPTGQMSENTSTELIQINDNPAKKTPQAVLNWSNYQINSRQDVELLLEKIFIYFEKHEPSHPAPLFIRRIQRLMNLNFYEIMKDISPDSLDRLETLIGQPMDNDFQD